MREHRPFQWWRGEKLSRTSRLTTCAAILGWLSVSASGDISVGGHQADASHSQWTTKCVAALNGARDELSLKHPGFRAARVRSILGQKDDFPGECGHHVLDVIKFEQPEPRARFGLLTYSAQVIVRSGFDSRPARPWARERAYPDSYSFERHDSGRTASTSVLDVDAPERADFTAALRRALDVCIAAAPAASPPAPPPTHAFLQARCAVDAPHVPLARCLDAERAASDLASLCEIQGRAIGDGGEPGRTQPAIRRITALGSAATSIFVRLSKSPNPSVRAAAAMGFGEVRSAIGRATLQRLVSDQEETAMQLGCTTVRRSVSSFARDALAL